MKTTSYAGKWKLWSVQTSKNNHSQCTAHTYYIHMYLSTYVHKYVFYWRHSSKKSSGSLTIRLFNSQNIYFPTQLYHVSKTGNNQYKKIVYFLMKLGLFILFSRSKWMKSAYGLQENTRSIYRFQSVVTQMSELQEW